MSAVQTPRGEYSRRHACIDCGEEASATRPNSRCVACSNRYKRVAANAWKCANRARRAAERAEIRAAVVAAEPTPERPVHEDVDIALYRAEKAKREPRTAQAIEDALRILSLYGGDPLKAKRGRPKKGQERAA